MLRAERFLTEVQGTLPIGHGLRVLGLGFVEEYQVIEDTADGGILRGRCVLTDSECLLQECFGLSIQGMLSQVPSHFIKQPGRFVWIGLHEPDEALLQKIQQTFGLHDLAIEDAHRAHQRPKLEEYGDS